MSKQDIHLREKIEKQVIEYFHRSLFGQVRTHLNKQTIKGKCLNLNKRTIVNSVIILKHNCIWNEDWLVPPSLYLNEILVHSEPIQGKCSSFIAAEDIHSSHFFNCCHPFSYCTLQINWEVRISTPVTLT